MAMFSAFKVSIYRCSAEIIGYFSMKICTGTSLGFAAAFLSFGSGTGSSGSSVSVERSTSAKGYK